MENFTGKLLQNYKQLEREIFRILLRHASNQCFLNLHDCTFNIEKMTIKLQKRHFEFVKPIWNNKTHWKKTREKRKTKIKTKTTKQAGYSKQTYKQTKIWQTLQL